MSFNTHDINPRPILDRTNYEEYFLLYVDDELTAEQKAAVEEFAAANPDLQTELEGLLGTKLPAEDVTLSGKHELLASHMQAAGADESLLLYIDDELPAVQKEALEQQLKTNNGLHRQYAELLKAKLDATEVIPFPYKQDLYRNTATRRMVYPWLRVAAAIVIILAAALLYWLQPATNNTPPPTVAQHTTPVEPAHPDTVAPSVSQPQSEVPSIALQKEAVANDNADDDESVTAKATPVHMAHMAISAPVAKNETAVAAPKKEEETDAPLTAYNNIDRTEETATVNPIIPTAPPAKQIIAAIPVTSATPHTYTITNASFNTTDADDDIADGSSRNKARLKGFFRKATRFIERTTNVRPANDDNELLIGTMAINLK